MSYSVVLTDPALAELTALPARARSRIRQRVGSLAEDPRPRGSRRLAGRSDLWRVRVGDYRVIYTIRDDELVVLVVRIGNRKRVYDRLSRLRPPDQPHEG